MVVGKNTFIDELIRRAGGTNIGAQGIAPYPVLNREEILSQNPDIILIPTDIKIPVSEMVQKYPEWKMLRAIRKGNVFYVDASILQRPGPRVIAGLQILRGIILSHLQE